ncbi:MAG: hypothetical protein V4764_13840 [Burkholderia sp.]
MTDSVSLDSFDPLFKARPDFHAPVRASLHVRGFIAARERHVLATR